MYLDKTLDAVTLSVRANGTYEPFSSEAWEYAGQMTLLGMMMVFSVLAILWGVLTVFKLIFASNKKKTQSVKEIKAETEKSADVTDVPVSSSDDAELVAVITAAVAAYMSAEQGTEVSPNGFRVVSFRKTGGGRSWNSK